jgi:NADH-quinone oxidoreductase subunit L
LFFLDYIWMVPLLPALGAALMFFFGRRFSKRAVSVICVGVVVVAFLLACGAVWQFSNYTLANHYAPYERSYYTWLGSGTGHLAYTGSGERLMEFKADVGILLDPLSSVWLLFVTGVGMLIHIYSIGYMGHEGGYYRFFGYLNLFMFSMLTLILGNNYALMFVGWEGVGLCSYLLIGFYFHRKSASDAANKAFLVNRIGDAGFILGIFTIAWYFGSVQFTTVTQIARAHPDWLNHPVLTVATLLLFVGACGKSAQIPLYVWLPDAMEGPTPVSALIHAATMVTAGVYMVARSNALFVLAPRTMMVVAIVGAFTAIFAATIGLVQNDIKRVLAYSTVSQLGYMFLACGVGAFAAGVFHVFTHAFFKALLFLGSGSVIHALSGEPDMSKMGGLRSKIPTTFWTMFIGALAIAGIPPLAGFFSKDEILWQTFSAQHGTYRFLWYLGFATALMTAFYMFRLIYLTFYGESRVAHEVEHHIHESPRSMTLPLILLALGSVFAGWLGWPHSLGGENRFELFLAPVFEPSSKALRAAETASAPGVAKGEAAGAPESNESAEYILMGASVLAAAAGMFFAYKSYGKAAKDYREPIAAASPPLYDVLFNKYFVDEFYNTVFTGSRKLGDKRLGVMGTSEFLGDVDRTVIDGGVNGAGWLTRLSGTISNRWDAWIIDGLLVNGIAIFTRTLSYPMRLVQWGQLQWYALVMVVGLAGFVSYYMDVGSRLWHWVRAFFVVIGL